MTRDDNQQSSSSEAQESERLRHSWESLLVSGGPQTARVHEAIRHTTGREEPWEFKFQTNLNLSLSFKPISNQAKSVTARAKGKQSFQNKGVGHITEPNEAEQAK